MWRYTPILLLQALPGLVAATDDEVAQMNELKAALRERKVPNILDRASAVAASTPMETQLNNNDTDVHTRPTSTPARFSVSDGPTMTHGASNYSFPVDPHNFWIQFSGKSQAALSHLLENWLNADRGPPPESLMLLLSGIATSNWLESLMKALRHPSQILPPPRESREALLSVLSEATLNPKAYSSARSFDELLASMPHTQEVLHKFIESGWQRLFANQTDTRRHPLAHLADEEKERLLARIPETMTLFKYLRIPPQLQLLSGSDFAALLETISGLDGGVKQGNGGRELSSEALEAEEARRIRSPEGDAKTEAYEASLSKWLAHSFPILELVEKASESKSLVQHLMRQQPLALLGALALHPDVVDAVWRQRQIQLDSQSESESQTQSQSQPQLQSGPHMSNTMSLAEQASTAFRTAEQAPTEASTPPVLLPILIPLLVRLFAARFPFLSQSLFPQLLPRLPRIIPRFLNPNLFGLRGPGATSTLVNRGGNVGRIEWPQQPGDDSPAGFVLPSDLFQDLVFAKPLPVALTPISNVNPPLGFVRGQMVPAARSATTSRMQVEMSRNPLLLGVPLPNMGFNQIERVRHSKRTFPSSVLLSFQRLCVPVHG